MQDVVRGRELPQTPGREIWRKKCGQKVSVTV